MGDENRNENNQLTRPFLKIYGDDVTGRKRPTNYVETLIHMIKGYVGTGIFAMGAAFYNSGMLLGPILLVAVTLLCLHCQHILVEACAKIAAKETVDVLPSYAETVKYTFEDSASPRIQKMAKVAGATTDIFLVFAEYGVDIVYLIFVSTHVKEISDAHGWVVDYRIWLAILLVPIWLPTFVTNLKILMPLSLLANILLWIGIGVIIYYTSSDLVPITERSLVAEYYQWPKCIGIVLFAFEGITFILNIRMEMKHRETFVTPAGILNVSIAIVVVLYFIVGFMTFWKYGECVKGSAFLNLPQRGIVPEAMKIGIAIAIAYSYTLHMYIPFEIAYPIFYQKFGPFKHPVLIMGLYRSFWVLVTYAFANIDSSLDAFIGLFGAITGAVVTMVLPGFIEIAMKYGHLGVWLIIKDIIIILIGIVGAVTGSVLSIVDIVNHIAETNSTHPHHHCNSTN